MVIVTYHDINGIIIPNSSGKREHEYEVIWEGLGRENQWFSRTELIEMGYGKMLNQKDESLPPARSKSISMVLVWNLHLPNTHVWVPYQVDKR
jgi:hypothetical protein